MTPRGKLLEIIQYPTIRDDAVPYPIYNFIKVTPNQVMVGDYIVMSGIPITTDKHSDNLRLVKKIKTLSLNPISFEFVLIGQLWEKSHTSFATWKEIASGEWDLHGYGTHYFIYKAQLVE